MTGQKPDKGPVFEARSGSTKVPVYTSKTRTCETFVVSWYDGSKRARKSFSDLEEAKRHAKRVAEELAKKGTATYALTSSDKLVFLRALELLRPYGKELDVAISEYVEALKALNGLPLVQSCKEYARIGPKTSESPSVETIVTEFLLVKNSAGRSERHVNDLKSRLGAFAKVFRCPLSSVNVSDVESWVTRMKASHRTKANHLGAVTNLIRFAERRGYLGKGTLDLSTIERGESHGEVGIFTPYQLRALLHHARPEIVPYIAIGAFAGLRSAELARLDWAEVGRTEIEIKSKKSKTRSRRMVPILPVLEEWIRPHRQTSGKVCTLLKPWTSLRAAANRAGFEWSPNALRHSFGTYRLAITKNELQTALEMGNSPAMVFRHYRSLVTDDKAGEWFATLPQAPAVGVRVVADDEAVSK